MRLFCRHRWEPTATKHVPGALERENEFTFSGGLWGRGASDALYGFTTVSLRCERCGDVKTRTVTGELVLGGDFHEVVFGRGEAR